MTENRPFSTRVLYFGSRFVILKRLDTIDLILATFLMSNAERRLKIEEVDTRCKVPSMDYNSFPLLILDTSDLLLFKYRMLNAD